LYMKKPRRRDTMRLRAINPRNNFMRRLNFIPKPL
jgi:hypothetical protein